MNTVEERSRCEKGVRRTKQLRRAVAGIALTAVVLGFGATTAVAVSPALVKAAKDEGRLVVYGDPTFLPPLVGGFTKAYPEIKVTTATFPGAQAYQRHLAETKAGRPIASVIYTGEETMLGADTDGELVKYRPEGASQMPEWAVRERDGFVKVHGVLCVPVYNNALIKNPPNDWLAFANPRSEWKDQIILADARNSSAIYTVVAALYQNFGPERAGTIFRGLKSIGAELSPNMGPQFAKVMSGERPIVAIGQTGYLSTMLNKGAPAWLVMPESGAVAQYTGMGVTKSAPNPNAGRLFVEYSISKEGQSIIAAQGGYGLRTDAPPPKGLPKFSDVKRMEVDLEKAVKDRAVILEWWKKSFGVE